MVIVFKILLVPLLSILFLCLPLVCSLVLIAVQFLLACCLKIKMRDQLKDLRPVIYYALLMLVFQLLSWLFSGPTLLSLKESFSWDSEKETIWLLLKIFAVLQTASLVFKTTTTLEMRDGIAKICGQKSAFTNAIYMFVNFIPMVSRIGEESQRAWFARGGKKSLRMYMTLLPILFSVGMKKAYNAARAVTIRS